MLRVHYAIINHETGEFHSLKQEYTTMSRRPGIAADWFAKYYEDVYPTEFSAAESSCAAAS
jgi:hypothetical protein